MITHFFDAVSLISVLEHIFSPPLLLDEICRVLKPDGYLIVQVPNFAWFPYRVQLLFGKLPLTGGSDELGIDWLHIHNFTQSDLRRFRESKGLKILLTSSSGVFAKFRRLWLSVLSADIIIKAVKKLAVPLTRFYHNDCLKACHCKAEDVKKMLK